MILLADDIDEAEIRLYSVVGLPGSLLPYWSF